MGQDPGAVVAPFQSPSADVVALGGGGTAAAAGSVLYWSPHVMSGFETHMWNLHLRVGCDQSQESQERESRLDLGISTVRRCKGRRKSSWELGSASGLALRLIHDCNSTPAKSHTKRTRSSATKAWWSSTAYRA